MDASSPTTSFAPSLTSTAAPEDAEPSESSRTTYSRTSSAVVPSSAYRPASPTAISGASLSGSRRPSPREIVQIASSLVRIKLPPLKDAVSSETRSVRRMRITQPASVPEATSAACESVANGASGLPSLASLPSEARKNSTSEGSSSPSSAEGVFPSADAMLPPADGPLSTGLTAAICPAPSSAASPLSGGTTGSVPSPDTGSPPPSPAGTSSSAKAAEGSIRAVSRRTASRRARPLRKI